jgi:hypothetical protein
MKLFGKKREPVFENRFKPKTDPPKESRFGRRKRAEQEAPPAARADAGGNRQHANHKERSSFKPLMAVGSVFDGTLLTNPRVMKNIPYILFVVFLAIIYISNSSSAEKKRRIVQKLDVELKELRYEYISTKSAVMYLSNPSQISERLREKGLQDNVVPPVKIFVREPHGDKNSKQ